MKKSITIFIFLLQALFISVSAMNEAPISDDSASKEKYSMLGITIGTPGINLLYGEHFSDFSIRGEIGPLGVQANFCYNLSNSKSFESNLSIGAGYTRTKKEFSFGLPRYGVYPYIGPCYNLNAGGFFFEFGLGFFTDVREFNDWNLFPLLQLGYVYRFNE